MNSATLRLALAELDAYYLAVSAAVTLAGASWGGPPAGTMAGLRVQLANVDSYRRRLAPDGDLGAAVLEGSITVERWNRVLNAQGETLQGILEQVDAEGVGRRLWSEVVVKSGSDLVAVGGQVADVAGDAARGLAAEGPGLFRWAVVGLVAYVALQALKVLR